MGNAGSNQPVNHGNQIVRETHRHSKEHTRPSSPGKDGQAFTFSKKPSPKLVFQSSQEEEEPYFTKVN